MVIGGMARGMERKKSKTDHSQAFLGTVQHGGQAGEKGLQVRSQITRRDGAHLCPTAR